MIGRGCFSKLVLVFIIITGISYYIVDKYGGTIWTNLKTNFINYVHNDINEKLSAVLKESAETEIREIIESYSEKIKEMDFSEAYDDASQFYSDMKSYLEDNKISEYEIFELKKYLEK